MAMRLTEQPDGSEAGQLVHFFKRGHQAGAGA